jgi:hypothetical protein
MKRGIGKRRAKKEKKKERLKKEREEIFWLFFTSLTMSTV